MTVMVACNFCGYVSRPSNNHSVSEGTAWPYVGQAFEHMCCACYQEAKDRGAQTSRDETGAT